MSEVMRAHRWGTNAALIADVAQPQDTPAERCPTCGSGDPARQQGLPHTDLHAQVRCRDPWHGAPPVEGER